MSDGKAIVYISQRISSSVWFTGTITAVILINALVIGLETVDQLHLAYASWFALIYQITVFIFALEAAIKLTAHHPKVWQYFSDPWNSFDFAVLVVCLIPGSGFLPILARVLRLLRVLSVIPALKVLVMVLLRSLPGMFNIVLLTLVIFYVYGVAGHHLFAEVDPAHWRSLGISLLSLFSIVTLENWTEIMYTAMDTYWWAWMFFVSLILIGSFVVVNLVIAVIIQNHQEAVEARHEDEVKELHDEEVAMQTRLFNELRELRETVSRLETQLASSKNPSTQ